LEDRTLPVTTTTAPPPSPRPRPLARLRAIDTRSTLVVTLTFLTGTVDASSFIHLGNVFTSVMTGNMVLLGAAVGRGALSALAGAALAIACYVAVTLLGAHLAGRPAPGDSRWPAPVTAALSVELLLFGGFALAWWGTGSAPPPPVQPFMLGTAAVALGIQSSAVLRLGVSGMSTTYLTGTLTTLAHTLVTQRTLTGAGRPLATLSALIAGGACGALLSGQAPAVLPAAVLLPLIAVILTGRRFGSDRRPPQGASAG
jgi:uncharacterized membrane protein YoaK (UPF0700 family)